jgi:hypothetical protein
MILMATNWERLLYKCSGLNAKSLFGLDFGCFSPKEQLWRLNAIMIGGTEPMERYGSDR